MHAHPVLMSLNNFLHASFEFMIHTCDNFLLYVPRNNVVRTFKISLFKISEPIPLNQSPGIQLNNDVQKMMNVITLTNVKVMTSYLYHNYDLKQFCLFNYVYYFI